MNMQSRAFPATNLDLPDLTASLTQWFQMQQFDVQTTPLADGVKLSARQASLGRKVVGMSLALDVALRQTGDTLNVEISAPPDVDAGIAAAIGFFVFAPVVFTGAWGMIQQAKLDDRTFAFIQQYLTTKQLTTR